MAGRAAVGKRSTALNEWRSSLVADALARAKERNFMEAGVHDGQA